MISEMLKFESMNSGKPSFSIIKNTFGLLFFNGTIILIGEHLMTS